MHFGVMRAPVSGINGVPKAIERNGVTVSPLPSIGRRMPVPRLTAERER